MAFHNVLESFVREAGCSTKEIAEDSGLSPSSVSRYRGGQRVPGADSDVPAKLASALAHLGGLDENEVREALMRELVGKSVTESNLPRRFDLLCGALEANMAAMARFLSYDASYLSRIRSGKRRPSDAAVFAAQVSDYACRLCSSNTAAEERVRALAEMPEGELSQAVKTWLLSDKPLPTAEIESVRHFIGMLDEFDLDDYIRAIKFDELKVPTVPFQLPTSKTYHGLEGQRQAELDFFKAIVLSKSTAPVTMHSDMPMVEMADDPDFPKKWMFGLAMMIKKGQHLDVIHDLDRPFAEMMLGLEAWVPLYMTGQVSPWYFEGAHNEVYCHLDYVGETAALHSECVRGHQADGISHLTNSKGDLGYYHRKAQHLLEKARPAMEVFRLENRAGYTAFLDADAAKPGSRHSVLSAPPLFVLPDDQLSTLLEAHGLLPADVESALATTRAQRDRILQIQASDAVQDEVLMVDEEEFRRHPVAIPLADALLESTALYTWEEYCAHLQQARAFAQTHEGYELAESNDVAFRNISVRFHDGQWALVSKNRAPAIHFVIRHPALLDAMEKFAPPVRQ